MRVTRAYAAVLAGALLLAACSSDPSGPTSDNEDGASRGTATSAPSSASAVPEDDGLPLEVSVADAGGESIEAGPHNDFAIAAAGGIWVTGVPPGLVRYAAATGEITHRIHLASAVVQALDATPGQVWVTGLEPNLLLVFDDRTGDLVDRVELPAPPVPESSVAADGAVAWVLVDRDRPRILRVDTVSGDLKALPTPDEPSALRYGAGSLWVTTTDGVERLDPDTGKVLSHADTGVVPSFLTFAYGAAWVLDQVDGTVFRVDAATDEVTAIPTSDQVVNGCDIAASDGFVWSRTWTGVTVVDAASGQAVARIGTGGGSGSVAAADGWLWITDHDHSLVHRVPWPPE
jgi:sugar lactone lactonase YvrE